MDDQSRHPEEPAVPRPSPLPWRQVALVFLGIVLMMGLLIFLIRTNRRLVGALGLAAVVPVAAATAMRQAAHTRAATREAIDQDFLKLWLSRTASQAPIITPTELCEVLNSLFRQDGRPEPFDSPGQMARELKKLGLQSSVRSVPGRPERRWYDLTGIGPHEPAS